MFEASDDGMCGNNLVEVVRRVERSFMLNVSFEAFRSECDFDYVLTALSYRLAGGLQENQREVF
jgi:hypothetical protein